ncbi:MAG: DEAD/DEAH box helicase [Saprospiraceae bacterium]
MNEELENFEALGLKAEIVKAITEKGYETPTPVQREAIKHIINSDQDLVALAQTGTGKTAAFSLPILHRLDTSVKKPQVLILSPTRELGIQIAKNIEGYTKHLPKVNSVAVYGGASIEGQIRTIKRGVHVVVGTPGRTLDLIRRKQLDFSNIQWLVLDEADEMLSMGFSDDLDAILEGTPEDKQTLLFSATMPPEISRIAKKYMSDYSEITIGSKNTGAKNVEHHYYQVRARDRYAALKRIVDFHPDIYGIIFCRTRQETKDIADSLSQEGYNADAIHGDVSQAQREFVMNRFRKKQLQLLVATDVAARGVDVNDLTHVINYNLPDDPEVYVHRSGRTGRAGKEGTSITIIHGREQGKLRAVQKMVSKNFTKQLVPSGEAICKTQLLHFIGKTKKVEVKEDEISDFLPAIYEKLEDLSKEEIIKQFVSLEFNRFLKYYENAADLNVTSNSRDRGDRNDRGDRRSRRDNANFSRFHLDIGQKHGATPKDIITLINKAFKNERVNVGQIDIMKSFSFFEVENDVADDVADAFNGLRFKKFDVNAEAAKPRPKRRDGRGDRSYKGKRGGSNHRFDNKMSSGDSRKRKKKGGKKRKPF